MRDNIFLIVEKTFWFILISFQVSLLISCDSAPSAAPNSLISNSTSSFPENFEDVGLYPDFSNLDLVVREAKPYQPKWPLWSNGSVKGRYIVLPEGTQIDNTTEDWVFPVGTLVFKTFSYVTQDSEGEELPYETRVIRGTEDGWEFAVYLWNRDTMTARKLDLNAPVIIPLVDADGNSFSHRVPTRLECIQCHGSNGNFVIGFDELQLNSKLNESDGQTQLESFHDLNYFQNNISDHPEEIVSDSEETTNVLGYVNTNCAVCHNGGTGFSRAFDMRYPVMLENTINRETESSGSAAGVRIIPGDAENSVLFQAVSGETDNPEVLSMPLIGVQFKDHQFIEELRQWINTLE